MQRGAKLRKEVAPPGVLLTHTGSWGSCWSLELDMIVSAAQTLSAFNAAGRTRIRLKPTGELFSLVPPTSKANNVIIGALRMLCCAVLYMPQFGTILRHEQACHHVSAGWAACATCSDVPSTSLAILSIHL